MSNPIEDLKARAAAAREGMDLGETTKEAVAETEELQEEEKVAETASPSEETTEESDDTETEEVKSKEDDEESDSDDTEEEEAHQPARTVFRELNEIRTQKRTAEANAKKLLEMIGAESMEDAVTKMDALKASAPLSPEFIEAAKSIGIDDPQNLKKLSDLVTKQVRSEMAGEINPLKDKVTSYESTAQAQQQEREWNESITAMDKEWKEVMPVLETEYKPTATQAQQAHELMIDLAHSEKYHDKELEYILYKEQEQFEGIFGAKKRKTMLPSRGAPVTTKDAEGLLPKVDASDRASVLSAKAKMDKIKNQQEFIDPDTERI